MNRAGRQLLFAYKQCRCQMVLKNEKRKREENVTRQEERCRDDARSFSHLIYFKAKLHGRAKNDEEIGRCDRFVRC